MRAWHCHGRNQRELVDRLNQAGIVRSPKVKEVMQQVDRQYYVSLVDENEFILHASYLVYGKNFFHACIF